MIVGKKYYLPITNIIETITDNQDILFIYTIYLI